MESMPRPTTAWYRRLEPWVFAVTLLLRLAVLSRYAETPYFSQQTGDMKFYESWAERILEGQFTEGHAFYGLPGYAWVLAGIYKLTGTDSAVRAFTVGVLQSLIEAVTAMLLFKIAMRTFRSESCRENERAPVAEIAAVLVSLGWATCIPAQSFSVILMPTAWLVCAYWFCVWVCMQPGEKRSLAAWAGFGVLIGAVAMMVATILFAIALFLVRIAVSVGAGLPAGKRAVRALSAAALLLAGVFAGASPAWIHNYFVVRDPVFLSAHSGLNFWMGNSPGANGYPKIPAGLRPSQDGLLRDSITWAEKAAGHPLKRSEISKYWSAKANDYIARYPEAWRALMLRKLRNFWNRFEYDDISVITLLRERGVLWPGVTFGVAAGFGLVGAALALIRRSPAAWVMAAVGLHMLAIMPVFVTERYRLAAVPGLLVLGVYALFVLWQMFRVRQTAWYGLAIVAGLALSRWVVTLPTDDPALRSLDVYNVGVKELAMAELLTSPGATPEQRASGQHELVRAEGHLTRAYQMVPGDPGIVFAMGNLAFDQGNIAAAKAYYTKTLALNPHFAGALNNLGFLATEEKRWADAERMLAEAVKEDPENARSHYLLALSRKALGETEAARASAAEAVRLAPKERKFRELLDRVSGK